MKYHHDGARYGLRLATTVAAVVLTTYSFVFLEAGGSICSHVYTALALWMLPQLGVRAPNSIIEQSRPRRPRCSHPKATFLRRQLKMQLMKRGTSAARGVHDNFVYTFSYGQPVYEHSHYHSTLNGIWKPNTWLSAT